MRSWFPFSFFTLNERAHEGMGCFPTANPVCSILLVHPEQHRNRWRKKLPNLPYLRAVLIWPLLEPGYLLVSRTLMLASHFGE